MNLQICTTEGEDILLRDVSTFLVDAETIRVLYNDGKQQNYPLQNVRWYGPEDPIAAPVRRSVVRAPFYLPPLDPGPLSD